MYKKGLLCIFMILAILIPSISQSQTEEIKDYTVAAGDTLWGISGKELGDPFLWPKIWQENPAISNPDRLYPGQKIKIPLRYAQKSTAGPEVAVAPPQKGEIREKAVEKAEIVPLRPLINRNILVASGFIADSPGGVGAIDGGPSGRLIFGDHDLVYVRSDRPTKLGDRFYILRKGDLVRHPATNKKMGYLVTIVGIAEIVRFEYGDTLAKITQMFEEIHSGDLLETYYEINPPLTVGKFRKPDITGYVVASRYGHLGNAKLDIVFVDKGIKDGLEVGDIVRTLNISDGHKIPSGALQIISCREATSAAVVLENYYSEVMVGNLIAKME